MALACRKLQQKYAVRPAAPDSPDVLPMPPRLAAGTPGQSRFAADAQQRQPALGGIGRWQAPQQQQRPSNPDAAVAAPSTANSQQRPCRTVRFTGVRSMSRSPAEDATVLLVQQVSADVMCKEAAAGQPACPVTDMLQVFDSI